MLHLSVHDIDAGPSVNRLHEAKKRSDSVDFRVQRRGSDTWITIQVKIIDIIPGKVTYPDAGSAMADILDLRVEVPGYGPRSTALYNPHDPQRFGVFFLEEF